MAIEAIYTATMDQHTVLHIIYCVLTPTYIIPGCAITILCIIMYSIRCYSIYYAIVLSILPNLTHTSILCLFLHAHCRNVALAIIQSDQWEAALATLRLQDSATLMGRHSRGWSAAQLMGRQLHSRGWSAAQLMGRQLHSRGWSNKCHVSIMRVSLYVYIYITRMCSSLSIAAMTNNEYICSASHSLM